MIKAIIFDWDGVILDSADIKTRVFRKLFQRRYPEKIAEIVNHHINNMGISRYIKFQYVYRHILKQPLSAEEEADLGRRFSQLALEEVLNTPFVPGALEFLKENQNKYILFVASGTPYEELRYIVQTRGLIDYFQEIHGSPPEKKEIINGILARHKWLNQEVVFIGDAQTDLSAAEDTSLHFIAIKDAGNKQFLECKYKIENLNKLNEILTVL